MAQSVENQRARLEFLADGRVLQDGAITPGGTLVIDYDTARLPNFRREWRDAVIWDVEIYVKFHPDEQLHVGSPLQAVRAGETGPVRDYIPQPFEITVPTDADKVEIWFHTSDIALGGDSEAWDSDYGQNYRFEVVRGGTIALTGLGG